MIPLLCIIAVASIAGAGERAGDRPVILATTTSVQDSGLLDRLAPAFLAHTGYRLKAIAVGTGQALELGRRGEADVLFAHAPALEREFVKAGYGFDRRLVMANEFFVVGPANDPAGARRAATEKQGSVAGAENVAERHDAVRALKAIATRGALFVSRGDKSGTHLLERALWREAALNPTPSISFVETGSGMGKTLAVASQRAGYTLTDSSTWNAHRAVLKLVVIVAGDYRLWNPYHVIRIKRPGATAPDATFNAAGAAAFASFVTSELGQALIGDFGRAKWGRPLFTALTGMREEDFLKPLGGAELPDASAVSGFALVRDGVVAAFRLIVSGDPQMFEVVRATLVVTLSATVIALLVGLPLGVALGRGRRRHHRFFLAATRLGMAIPPVVVGLVIGILFWRTGPLGAADLLYTPGAMILAQALLALPIAATFAASAMQAIPVGVERQIVAMGATRAQRFWLLVREARHPLVVAALAAFSRALTEVGASIMVGGNVLGETRILTTATVMEVGRGRFEVAIAFGLILVVIAIVVHGAVAMLTSRRRAP